MSQSVIIGTSQRSTCYAHCYRPPNMGEALRLDYRSRVLDIGCLFANNLVPFHDRGCECRGIEVTHDALVHARAHAERHGIGVRLHQGTNRAIPFSDRFFDLVLSIGTIHYEESVTDVRAGLQEMGRVLKPDCTLLISTAGQEHEFVSTAKSLGDHRYACGVEDDFRRGQVFTFFDSLEHFRSALAKRFAKVSVAEISERYPKTSLQFYVGRCSL